MMRTGCGGDTWKRKDTLRSPQIECNKTRVGEKKGINGAKKLNHNLEMTLDEPL